MKPRQTFLVLLAIVLLVFFGGAAFAVMSRTPDKAPAPLTETVRLQLQNRLQRLQILQLQREKIEIDLKREAEETQKLFQSLQVEGYDLNLQTFQYEKKKKP
jgi:hypothetical protein